MYDEKSVYPAEMSVSLDGRRRTLRERLVEVKNRQEESLISTKAAIEFLDKNPSFEEFHNLIGKAGF